MYRCIKIPVEFFVQKFTRNVNENASPPQLRHTSCGPGLPTTTMSRSNRAARGGNFTHDEIDSLLDTVEEVMPIGMDEWALVERRHMASYPDRSRTKESLRRKFQLLYLSKQQTGTPECPPEVRRAKSLVHAIREKAEVSSAGSVSVVSSQELDEQEPNASNNEDSPAGINMVETATEATSEATTTNDTTMPPTRGGIFETPVARVGRKRKKRVNDDDDEDVSMKDLVKFAMTQQQLDREESRKDREEGRKDRQMMMQMMSMAMMSMVSNNSRNAGNNDLVAPMMQTFTAYSAAADRSSNPDPTAGTVTTPCDVDLDGTTEAM